MGAKRRQCRNTHKHTYTKRDKNERTDLQTYLGESLARVLILRGLLLEVSAGLLDGLLEHLNLLLRRRRGGALVAHRLEELALFVLELAAAFHGAPERLAHFGLAVLRCTLQFLRER